ncbi:hypothetical protein AVEN_158583-1 [Araneus ventricosus]|uniref:HTH CENPB-type domain-containing protein n=1 Tax=Araneus ventricosus TaxID=182803 RepID=A0A4Y2JQJ8_ARAVE|nr:hypothetical protein AVEN_158583-1 [Araneus ventricosus]
MHETLHITGKYHHKDSKDLLLPFQKLEVQHWRPHLLFPCRLFDKAMTRSLTKVQRFSFGFFAQIFRMHVNYRKRRYTAQQGLFLSAPGSGFYRSLAVHDDFAQQKISVVEGKKGDENQHLQRVDLAKELGLPVSTLITLIYKHKIIEGSHHQDGSSASKKLRVQIRKLAVVEKMLLQWFNQCRRGKIPSSGLLLMEESARNFEEAECGMRCIIFYRMASQV